MKSLNYLILLVVLLASCSCALSGGAVQAAIVQTEIARPTKTFVFILTAIPTLLPPTPIPLADLDLSSILVQSGDLPAGYSGAQILSSLLKGVLDNAPKPVYQIYQQLSQNDKKSGNVIVLVYDTSTVANDAYNTIEENWPVVTPTVPVIEDKSQINFYIKEGLTFLDLLFVRCKAVGFIRLMNATDTDNIISYAQRLDERLTPLVCP